MPAIPSFKIMLDQTVCDHDTCYAALTRRDPRYDGVFFVAVRTTRIYCRPICPARTPLSRNVTFYAHAAQAHEAGYRPCLRCRPESAPDSPTWLGTLASVNRALRLIEEGALVGSSVAALAERLGMTGRHLRRLFVQHLGVGPLAVEQTRRVHLAKKLLHETALPVTSIAFAAGFGSLRRFNEVFAALFRRPPSAIRRDAGRREPGPIRLRLAVPADAGVPVLDKDAYRAVVSVEGREVRVALRPDGARTVLLEMDGVPLRHLARVVTKAKRDLLPQAAAASIARSQPRRPSFRGSRSENPEPVLFSDKLKRTGPGSSLRAVRDDAHGGRRREAITPAP